MLDLLPYSGRTHSQSHFCSDFIESCCLFFCPDLWSFSVLFLSVWSHLQRHHQRFLPLSLSFLLPKAAGKAIPGAYFPQDTKRMNTAEGSTKHVECAQTSRRKNVTNSLEHKIKCLERQRKELLEVNHQWEKQFTSMKEFYEKKVAELEKKLDAKERLLSTQESRQSQGEGQGLLASAQELLTHTEKENMSLNEELQKLKTENKQLKEINALTNKKKEHYECEIIRLNKAIQDILKIESSSFPEHCLGKSEMNCSQEELRTEMEVLKQQVQIYEEDFKKERSDRERLNQEKEELQKINQTSQSQLNRLHSKIKACQMEKEKLEKQLKQMYFPSCTCGLGLRLWDPSTAASQGDAQESQKQLPDYQWYAPDQFPPDVLHKANGVSSEKRVSQ